MPTYDEYAWEPAAELKRLARLDEPWCFYLETEVFLDDGDKSGTVRPAHKPSATRPPFPPLHVISATQPTSKPKPGESATRLAILVAELNAARIRSIRAVGSSFSGDHREESRAVFGLKDSCARELGIRFGQVAIFSWKGPHWSLLACADYKRVDRPWHWEEERPVSNG